MTDKISVLLLDDEKGPLATVKDALEVDGRFRVKTFDSYKEAIVYTLKKRDIDVIVTDHRMKDPKTKLEDWNACHVAEDIFNLDNTIKVLVYTAYFNEFKESLLNFYEQKKDFVDSKNFNDFYEKRIFLTVDKRESIDELVIKILRAAETRKAQKMAEYSALNGLICVAIAQDRRDPYLAGHSRRVTCDALEIGRELNLTSNILRSLVRAGLLHDIGKIAVPDRVLIKNDKLNEEEMRLMKQHPFVAAEIVESLKDSNLVDFVMFHHEWYDGSGSYYGKKGEDIPVGARILSVADSYDAMTSNRAYRKAMTIEDAISELIRNKGKQFDPSIVDIFVEKKIYLRKGDFTRYSVPEFLMFCDNIINGKNGKIYGIGYE